MFVPFLLLWENTVSKTTYKEFIPSACSMKQRVGTGIGEHAKWHISFSRAAFPKSHLVSLLPIPNLSMDAQLSVSCLIIFCFYFSFIFNRKKSFTLKWGTVFLPEYKHCWSKDSLFFLFYSTKKVLVWQVCSGRRPVDWATMPFCVSLS